MQEKHIGNESFGAIIGYGQSAYWNFVEGPQGLVKTTYGDICPRVLNNKTTFSTG
jgi:hypothetical protein